MHAVHELAGPIIAHAALGVGFAVLVWAVGVGVVVRFASLLRRPLQPEDVLLGYPFGLLVVVVALFLALVDPIGAVVGVALLVASLVPLRRCPPELRAGAGAAARTALRVAPFALGYAIVTAFLYHGATHDLDSHVLGDNAAWVSRTYSLLLDPLRYPDLTTMGYLFPRPEAATPIFAAAASKALPVDFFLFGAASMPMYVVLSVGGGLGALYARAERASGQLSLGALAGGGLLVASLAYPSWIPETTTMALALPLALTVAWMILTRLPFATFLGIACAVLLAIVTTKILASIAVVGVLGAHAVRAYGPLRGRRLVGTVAAAATALIVASVLFFTSAGWMLRLLHPTFLPYTAAHEASHYVHVRTLSFLGPGLRVVGEVVLCAALARRRLWAPFVGVVASVVVYWLIRGQEFVASATLVVLIAAAISLRRPQRDTLLLVAAALLGVSSWWLDPTEYRGSFAMGIMLATAGVFAYWRATAAQVAAGTLAAAAFVALALAGHVDVAFVLACAIALLAVGLRNVRVSRFAAGIAVVVVAIVSGLSLARGVRAKTANFGVYDDTVYTHEAYLVWRRVAHIAPRDALVFTSRTGLAVASTSEGWDYYPGVSGRQVYLAGWNASSLRVKPAELRTRLALNHRVLTGSLAPSAVPGTSAYHAFYAVLAAGAQHPRTFRLLYANSQFALYAIR